jgi:hypothetical protein
MNNDENDEKTNKDEIKTVFIPQHKWTPSKTKEIKAQAESKAKERAKITKVQSRIWNLTNEQKSTDFQLSVLTNLLKNDANDTPYLALEIMKLLKIKQSSYKSQDLRKNKYCAESFVSIANILSLLCESHLVCLYCSDPVSVLYEYAYDPKQWTLDRVDNEVGHNVGNVVIACLECNLKRRVTNKNKFQLGKKIILTKLIKEEP